MKELSRKKLRPGGEILLWGYDVMVRLALNQAQHILQRREYFLGAGAIAFDMTGKQLWKKSVGRESKSRFGSAASPILYKDTLIVTAANESATIRGLDTKTGKELWKASAGSLSGSYSTPIIAKNTDGVDQLLVSVTYELWALSPKTGKLKWYAETRVGTAACTAIIVRGTTAYVVGGRGTGGRTAVTIGGKGDVTKTNVKWSMGGGSYVSSPVLYKGHLYWTNGAIAHCVEAKTGKEVGRKRLGGTFYASITLIKDKLVAVTRYVRSGSQPQTHAVGAQQIQ